MRTSQLLAAVLAVSTVSASWDNFFDNVQGLAKVENVLYGRQENSDSNQATATNKSDAPKSTATGTADNSQTTGDAQESGTASGTGQASDTKKTTGSGTAKETGSKKPSGTKTGGDHKSTSYDARLPAGGLSMVTPAATAGAQFYKIGDWVTFAWNYTSLSATPSAIDILATCSANQATYTLAVNHSATDSTILWDTGNYQKTATVPLLTETYTLLVYDADSSISAAPAAGYLGVYNQFTFGMYTAQPYVNWSDFTCANCNPNGSLSPYESLTLRMMLITSGTTLASLLYFAYSFGVI